MSVYYKSRKKPYRKPDSELTPEEMERRKHSLANIEGHKWKKGQSGNPSGINTPKEAKELMKDVAYDAVCELIRIAQDRKDKKQLQAIEDLLDRIWGKPNQPIDISEEDKNIKIEFVNGDYGE